MATNQPDITEIDLSEIKNNEFLLRKEYRIAISTSAYETISNHANENTSFEICGVLIGNIFKDKDGPFLDISDAIRGEHADNKMGEVTFTQETWSYINNIKDTEFSEKKVVGWYHSHPNFGIFLSSHDLFIQNNFFAQPWQVAFVIDPVKKEEGFFIWDNGNAVNSGHFWLEGKYKETLLIGKDENKGLVNNLDQKIENIGKLVRKGLKPIHYLAGVIILVLLLIFNYVAIRKHAEQILNATKYKGSVVIKNDTREIYRLLESDSLLSGINFIVKRKGNNVWCYGEVPTSKQGDLVYKIIKSIPEIESVDMGEIKVTHKYIVLPGETLGIISTKIYGIESKWKDIYNKNRSKIPDLRHIDPYTTLEIPE